MKQKETITKYFKAWEHQVESVNTLRGERDKFQGGNDLLRDANAKLEVERDRLKEENENLCSVMIAAAETIKENWHKFTDEEGYGPQNLLHRLEHGIAALYPGYTAGRWEQLENQNGILQDMINKRQAEIDSLKEQLADRKQSEIDNLKLRLKEI